MSALAVLNGISIALTVGREAMDAVARYQELLATSVREGRPITQAELDSIRSDSDRMTNDLVARLRANPAESAGVSHQTEAAARGGSGVGERIVEQNGTGGAPAPQPQATEQQEQPARRAAKRSAKKKTGRARKRS